MIWLVDILESERGWGQKIDSTQLFNTFEEAKNFQKKFNSDNTSENVPDWYMVALEPRYKE